MESSFGGAIADLSGMGRSKGTASYVYPVSLFLTVVLMGQTMLLAKRHGRPSRSLRKPCKESAAR